MTVPSASRYFVYDGLTDRARGSLVELKTFAGVESSIEM